MSSTRLPGKVLLPLGDTTILGHTVRRVQEAKSIGKVVVATSDQIDDDTIEKHGKEIGVEVYRGSLNDVLDRYYGAAKQFGAENVVRVTADCPLIDPALIDRVVAEYEKSDCDYISTGRIVSTFPDGMDSEIFSFESLERAWKEAKLSSEREHVTPYIWNHPELFRVREVKSERGLSAVRWTIDEPNDYKVMQNIIANTSDLTMEGIVRYLEEHPEIAKINGSIIRDEGYFKSLKSDAEKK